MEIRETPAWALAAEVRAGRLSSRQLAESVLAAIEAREAEVGAYLALRPAPELLKEADAIDQRVARGEDPGPLCGVPTSVKDNLCTEGLPTTCASRMLEGYRPPYEATVVTKLRQAGALIVGKTNMDEFAMGCSTENSAFKTTRNPHALTRVPGGTSGGAAASVAADEAILALASDTGGSIRQPASFCGVVGFKPTYGRVSRLGLIAYASSFDQVGPIARDVRSAGLLASVVSGHDPGDATSLQLPPLSAAERGPQAPLRIGIPKDFFESSALHGDVGKAVMDGAKALESAGHQLVDISLPLLDAGLSAYYIIACAEASSNLARFDGARYGFRCHGASELREMYVRSRSEGFGAEVRKRILLGTYVLSAGYHDQYYNRACQVRTVLRENYARAYEQCDVILHPTAPFPAYEIGSLADDNMAQYLGDIYSVVANLVGMPAISLPCGRSQQGLPIGAQLSAAVSNDELLLSAALDLERVLGEAGAWQAPRVAR